MIEKEKKKHWLKQALFSKKRFWIGIILTSILVLVSGAHLYSYFKTHVSTDDAFIESRVIQISPKVPGHVIKVLVDDNQEVEEGTLLVEQDDRDYAQYLLIAKAELEASEAERIQAYQDMESYKKLEARDELSKQQLDKALLRLRTAQAQVSKAKANREKAELQISYTKIKSPSKGRVTHKNVEIGDYIQTGQALMAIVPPERWVIANFKETQLTNMQPGQEASIKVDAYPQKIYKGRVDSIQRGTGARFSLLPAENASGNFIKVVQRVPVKIVFDEVPDTGRPFLPGLSVAVTVKTP